MFLLYTFALSWISWGIILIGNKYFDTLWYGEPLFWIPFLLGALGPMGGFYLIYKKYHEEFKFNSFTKFVINRNITKKISILFLLFTLWRLFMIWFGFGIENPISIAYIFLYLPLYVLGGGLEEVGWRGYLQPKLEELFNFIPATIIVGVIWSLWHLPLWLMEGAVQSKINFFIYTIMAIILSFSFSILYKYSKNITLCILSHAWYNGCIGLAVYIGADGYLQLDIGFKILFAYVIELCVSVIFGVIYNYKHNSTTDNIQFKSFY